MAHDGQRVDVVPVIAVVVLLYEVAIYTERNDHMVDPVERIAVAVLIDAFGVRVQSAVVVVRARG